MGESYFGEHGTRAQDLDVTLQEIEYFIAEFS